MKKEKWTSLCYQIIFPIVLLLYPLRHFAYGVDFSDTGYSLVNYTLFGQSDGMWTFATYLANLLGHFFTKLPGGDHVMVFNIYTGLFVSGMAFLAYFWLKKYFSPTMVFIGEFIAISLCWCPTVIFYQYLTYFLFLLVVWCLFNAITQEKSYWYLVAGILLGFNIMTRFSNLTQCALILVVWYAGYLYKKKASQIWMETGLCIGGFFIGLGALLVAVSIQFSFSSYLMMLNDLFLLGSGGGGGDYSLMAMIGAVASAYLVAAKWLLCYVLLTVVGFALYRIDQNGKNKVLTVSKNVVFVVAHLFLLRFLWGRGMFNFLYETYPSMQQWATILLLLTLVLCVVKLCQKEVTNEMKILYAFLLVIILITPLGSNNHIYSNINNMFLVAPIFLGAVYEWIRGEVRSESRKFISNPIKLTLVFICAVLLFQSTLFGVNFVFRGKSSGYSYDGTVMVNEHYKGMKTSKDRASALDEITIFMKDNPMNNTAIFYGAIPGISYALDIPCAISTTWPDLESYEYETMEKEIGDLYNDIPLDSTQEKPFIIFGLQAQSTSEVEQKKMDLMKEIMVRYEYQQIFANDWFAIYQ